MPLKPAHSPGRHRTHPARRTLAFLTLLALGGAAALSARAQIPFPPPALNQAVATAGSGPNLRTSPPAQASAQARWQSSLADFARHDQLQPPASDGVLFVGSSTIRMWQRLSQDFRDVPVIINRGFGGSTLRDCHALVRELVIQYRPRQVMVYAGDNDLAEGRSPDEVLASFEDFVRSVRTELPGARITYISIKPSPLRAALLPKVRQTNALIAGYVQGMPELRYVDIFSPMLAADGLPRPELFLADRLHLNEAGYRLWQTVIAADLLAAPAPAARPAQQVAGGS